MPDHATWAIRLGLACLLGLAPITLSVIPLGVGAHAADSPVAQGPDLRSVRAQIKAKKYDAALAELKVLVVSNQIPDVFSLLGFTLRKTGDRAQSMIYYNKALAMDPGHRGAREYQGELFVELGQIDKAKANLERLKRVCWFGCEEMDDLKEAIEHAPNRS
jgi:tetratricopeptide (TPR) repeat protein